MLTLTQFKGLTNYYGADLKHWPMQMRGEAQALLVSSVPARALLAEARALEEALEAARRRPESATWL
jgi:hypothetical protein